jgi:hypothetical protein
MRHLILTLGLTLALATPARANGPTDFAQARELKSAGKALTGVGVALHVVSIPLVALAAISMFVDHPAHPGEETNPFAISGAALTAASAITLGTGVGLWGAGARAERNERAWALSPAGLRISF